MLIMFSGNSFDLIGRTLEKMTWDDNKKELEKAPLWHEAYARQEIVRKIVNQLDHSYECPLCQYHFTEKHELMTHLMWLKDEEHTIDALQLQLKRAGNDQRA